MATNIPINHYDPTAPTPQNTPMQHAPIGAGLSRPTVPDIKEDAEEEEVGEMETSDIKRAMLGLVHGRLAELVGRSSGYVESLPADVRLNVEALKGVQVKQSELQNQYKRECLELEKKYLLLQQPLYARRKDIVSGKAKPTSEEIKAGEESSTRDDPEYTPVAKEGVEPSSSGIPEFWLTALRNHIAIADLITDRDADALKHLTDVTIEYLPSDPGFTLSFHFSANEFFSNEVLTKTYVYQKEVGYTGDFVYDHATGCTIEWKEEKDLTKEVEVKKQRNKNTNRTRLVRKTRPTDSFFNFFSPPTPPKEDEESELDEDELEELEEKLELDYQLGEDFKEKIIPRAIDYFTGKALELEGLDSDEDDYEDIDDDDDDEFDDDDDSDNDIPVTKGRTGPPKGRGGNSANVDPEECKQQ